MTLKELQEDRDCGECSVVDYCADPDEGSYEDPCICKMRSIWDLEEEEFLELARKSKRATKEGICESVALVHEVKRAIKAIRKTDIDWDFKDGWTIEEAQNREEAKELILRTLNHLLRIRTEEL